MSETTYIHTERCKVLCIKMTREYSSLYHTVEISGCEEQELMFVSTYSNVISLYRMKMIPSSPLYHPHHISFIFNIKWLNIIAHIEMRNDTISENLHVYSQIYVFYFTIKGT